MLQANRIFQATNIRFAGEGLRLTLKMDKSSVTRAQLNRFPWERVCDFVPIFWLLHTAFRGR